MRLLLCITFIFMFGFTANLYAKNPSMDLPIQNVVTGTVTESATGNPLPGVTVIIQRTTIGATTNANGQYSLANVPSDAFLVFSFVGMLTQTVAVDNRSVIDIAMEVDAIGIEELVVVGYGTQVRANLTGSVATVSGAEITRRPTPNLQNLLQGRVSGLNITQMSGRAGNDPAIMRIRGIGTFSGAGSEPLILIDGVAGDMRDLDPNNVESVTVMKDASSAAIYGARAANGVILITTKRGQPRDLEVNYHVTFEAQQATILPDLLYNSADYMEMWNEANIRRNMIPWFSQEEINAFRNNPGDPRYPNHNWIDHSFRTAFSNNHHLSVSGGTESTTVNLAVGFLGQDGITGKYDHQRYSIHLTADSRVRDWLQVGGNIQTTKRDVWQDVQGSVQAVTDGYYFLSVYGAGPNMPPTMTLDDGTTTYVARYSDKIQEWTVRNPDAVMDAGSNNTNNHNIAPQVYMDITLAPGLTWYSKGAVNFSQYFRKLHEHPVDNHFFDTGVYAHNNATWHLGVQDWMSTGLMTTFFSTLNYRQVVADDHTFNLMAGYNQEYSTGRSMYVRRTQFPTRSLREINAGSPAGQSLAATSNEWAIQSFFGRFMYDYQGKYLFEANARYDGTSRIAPDTRWGLFPSFSAAWRISEESFMDGLAWLDNLKFRGSWGQLGNQNVGLYPYQDILSTTSYVFDALQPGVLSTRLVDRSLQWETTTVLDIGVDFSINKGLFSLTVDWYDKLTEGILYGIPVPASIGLSGPTVNGGEMKNVGWDFELGHRNNIGNVNYFVSANLSTYKNEVLSILSPTLGALTVQEGLPYQSWYMVEWEGIFQSQAEIDAAPTHPNAPKPGDLRFRDANGDGVINADDRVIIDGAHPKFYYGGSINLNWNNFDVSAFIQGVEGQMRYQTNWGVTPFVQGSPPTMDLFKNRWTESNPSTTHPAMYRSNYMQNMYQSTYWLRDASYLRLKNLRIGYNLPSSLVQRMGMRSLQVYFSGDNLLTFTDFPEFDPEKANLSDWVPNYPQLKTFAFGINVKL